MGLFEEVGGWGGGGIGGNGRCFCILGNNYPREKKRGRGGGAICDHDNSEGISQQYSLLVACLTPQQHTSVSQGRICADNLTCCHTEIEAADQSFHLTLSYYTDTGPTSPSADPITPDAWQGSHWSAHFQVTGMARPRKNPDASGIRSRDLPL